MRFRRSGIAISRAVYEAGADVSRTVAVIVAAAVLAVVDLTPIRATAADQNVAGNTSADAQGGTAAAAAGVVAQNANESTAAGTQGGTSTGQQLQEVVVTAERRAENLQTTAISATVLDSSELVQKGVVTIQDLQNASPALSITPSGLTANVNIRGIGLDSGSPAVVPGVAEYRDGLWQPPIITTDTLYDVDSVQILRGPQGTFVGSNSTGGAIFINSRDPDLNGVHGYAQLQYGNYSDFGGQGAVNLPINDAWAVRVATDLEERDSFFQDVGSASKLTPGPQLFGDPGSLDEKNVRLGLLGKPSGDLTVVLKVEVNDKSTGGYAYRPVPGTEYAPYANPNPFTLDYDQTTQNDELGIRSSLRLDWNIGDSGLDLRSITGEQFMRVHNLYDLDGTDSTLPGPPALAESQAIIERPITQEFDLISPNDGRLQWIAGTFYLHDIREVVLDDTSQSIPVAVEPYEEQILQSAAAFGQVSYQIVPRLQLQVGLRYTHDWNEATDTSHVTIDFVPGAPAEYVPLAGIETDSATTGKVALNFTLDEENFLYAFVAKGFKAGGFNAGSATTPQTNFAPEVVWDYEVGWKGQYFDDHLTTSLDGFWDNYTNLQVDALNPTTGEESLVNTGKSVIKGGEAELHGRIGGLGVDTGAGYVNSRLGAVRLVNTEALPPGVTEEGLPQCALGMTPPGCFYYGPYTANLSGAQNPYSPEWTFNAGVQYAFLVGQSSTLTPRINYSYVGSQWTTLFEEPVTDYLPSFGLWNATVTYELGQWKIQAYGLNLADKVYVTGQLAAGTNPDNEFLGNPRQFGLRIMRTFGSE